MDATRRQFVFTFVQLGALTLTGGLVWGWLLHESQAQAFALRPPGALPEADYRAACIKCGMCVDACPYGTLALTPVGSDGTIGMPRYEPRQVPCYMCPDVPCARACPSGALERTVRIEEARMGLAVLIDQENCLAFQGLRCEVCYRVCPLMGKAISLRYRPQERTGIHAFFEPVVSSEACTGCGLCELACVLELPAIKVLPRSLAQGRRGAGYRLGWKEPARISPDFGPQDAQGGPQGKGWTTKTLDKAMDKALDALEDTEGLP